MHLKNPIPINQIWTFRYEDLVANPEGELKKICRFLGVDYEKKMQHYQADNYLKLTKVNATMAKVHKNLVKPINNYNIGRYKKQLSPSQITLLYYFFEEEFKTYNFNPPTKKVALSLSQKYVLFKARLQFKLKMDVWNEWFIRLKIQLKYLRFLIYQQKNT